MATIKDIANLTGFSITTVSRALNGYDDVNEKTRNTITNAAKKLNYSPNILAQNLVKKKSKTIGIMVNDLKRESSKDNLMFEMLCGANDALNLLDYEFILLSTTTAKQKNKSFQQICAERQLAGVIIQGLKTEDPYLEEVKNSEIPCVLIDIPISDKKIKYVTSNQIDSIKGAIKYLHRLGHNNIAYVNGSKNAHVSTIRHLGYTEALTELNIQTNPKYIINGEFNENKTKKAITSFLIDHPEVTAIFCASDVMALGVISAAKELGLNIPEQLSIIGFDNILLSSYITPSLTTISQSPYKMAKKAVTLLTDLIEDNKITDPFKTTKNELIIRDSTTFAPSSPSTSSKKY